MNARRHVIIALGTLALSASIAACGGADVDETGTATNALYTAPTTEPTGYTCSWKDTGVSCSNGKGTVWKFECTGKAPPGGSDPRDGNTECRLKAKATIN